MSSAVDIDTLLIEIKTESDTAGSGIDKLVTTLNKLNATTSKLQSPLDKLSNKIRNVGNSSDKSSKSFINFGAKLTAAYLAIKQGGKLIGSAIEKSSSYNETINLFTIAMGEYANEASEYVKKVETLMGIDPKEWMYNQGIFMTLATGFGVASDRAHEMSQQLTQLGYDLSSFVDISVDEAMMKVRSGLSGELEPLRNLGYDLSQAKLEATALSLGIDKSVSSMTQAEKAQLRYYAIMTQVTTAHGDMARTLESPANQMRIFEAQVEQTTRSIGNIFIPALNAILPIANAVLQVIRALADIIANLFGYKIPEVDLSGVSSGASSAGVLAEGLGDASDAAKKLKNYTMGFDELNVINPDSGGSGTETAPGGGGFDFELPKYDFLDGIIESKVSTIVKEMKEWLGITDEIDTWAELFDTRLGKILITVGLIGAGIVTWKIGAGIVGFFTSLYTAITSFSSSISTTFSAIKIALSTVSTPILAIIAAIATLIVGLTAVYLTNESVRNSVNETISNIGEAFIPLINLITDTIIPSLITAWDSLLQILSPLGDWLVMVFTSIWEDMLIPALNYVGDTVIPSLTSTLSNFWNNVLVPFGSFIGSVLTPVINILADVLTMLWKNVILPLSDVIGFVFKKVWEDLVEIFNELVVPQIRSVIDNFTFLWKYVLMPIIDFLWDVLKPVFEEVFTSIGNIIGNLKMIFGGLIDFVLGVFTENWRKAWQGVVDIFSGIFNTITGLLKIPVNAIIAIIEGLVNKLIDGWNWLKKEINSLSIEIPEWLGGGTLGFNLEMSKHVTIPRFADGGFPETGELFVAREAGAEMVGSIGRRTAVANNDQIVSGIANGVAEANSEQNSLLREQNNLLRALLEKDTSTNIDGRRLSKELDRVHRGMGATIITGGAY